MSTHSREAVPGLPFPHLAEPSRTIHLGRSSSVYGPICEALGIGEYHAPNYNIPPDWRTRAGWFVSPAEKELITAEVARRRKAAKARRREQNRQRELRIRAQKKPVDRRKLALETWRNEWSDPLSPRKTPQECWVYAARFAFDLDEGDPIPPMPREKLPPRPSRASGVEMAAFCRHDDGNDVQISRPARMGVRRG